MHYESSMNTSRIFAREDLVYAKLYHRNGWKWVPAVVVQKRGSVVYKLNTGQRMIISHMNQLKRRGQSIEQLDNTETSSASHLEV